MAGLERQLYSTAASFVRSVEAMKPFHTISSAPCCFGAAQFRSKNKLGRTGEKFETAGS